MWKKQLGNQVLEEAHTGGTKLELLRAPQVSKTRRQQILSLRTRRVPEEEGKLAKEMRETREVGKGSVQKPK